MTQQQKAYLYPLIITVLLAMLGWFGTSLWDLTRNEIQEIKQTQTVILESTRAIADSITGQRHRMHLLEQMCQQQKQTDEKQWGVINSICRHNPEWCIDGLQLRATSGQATGPMWSSVD